MQWAGLWVALGEGGLYFVLWAGPDVAMYGSVLQKLGFISTDAQSSQQNPCLTRYGAVPKQALPLGAG